MRHLFLEWKNVVSRFNGRVLFIFLDYDGTLSPIVNRPRDAVLPKRTQRVIQELARSFDCKVAVISGRELSDVKKRVGVEGIVYAGNHGLEIEGPQIRFKSFAPPRWRAFINRLYLTLSQRFATVPGVIVENKGLTLSVHYRLVPEEGRADVKTIFHETLIVPAVKNKVSIRTGKCVLEVRPPTAWDKGKAVAWLLARQEFCSAGKPVLPIYVGDDVTDEDAFKAIRKKGVGIFVGEPRQTHAQLYLRNDQEVCDFLRRVSRERKGYGRDH